MELGYARVSTTHQQLDRQRDALREHGLVDECIYTDRKTGATTDRPGLSALLAYARAGDAIVCLTLDRLGRNLRECLNLAHELGERGIGIRTLADPLPIDTRDDSPMAQMAMTMLALFGEMERTYARERAAHARSVAERSGQPAGRPRKVDADTADALAATVDSGMRVTKAAGLFGVSRATAYRTLREREDRLASTRGG